MTAASRDSDDGEGVNGVSQKDRGMICSFFEVKQVSRRGPGRIGPEHLFWYLPWSDIL